MADDTQMSEENPDNEGPELADLPEDQRRRLVELMEKMLGLGIFAVYGQEEEGVPDANVACARHRERCGTVCCSFSFALTKEEVRRGIVRHDPERPFYILRGTDGHCAHLDRGSMHCGIWKDRPLRCRRYDCAGDRLVWPEGKREDADA